MSRQDVLALLREQEGAFVSGEEISHRLGLSRAAIWKAVDALRREGYTVEARTGRGYRLLDAPDVLTEPEIRRFLGEHPEFEPYAVTKDGGFFRTLLPETDGSDGFFFSAVRRIS